jgi:translation initiation factor IF-2
MAVENKEETKQPAGQGPFSSDNPNDPRNAGTKPEPKAEEKKPEPKAEEKKPEPKAETKTETKTEKAEGKEGKHEAVNLADDEDDIPEDATLLNLSRKGLKGRLDRYSKKQLKEHFGTDDVDEISKKLKKAEELTAKEEERRRATLAKEEKLEEDLKAANTRADQAEARAQAVLDQRILANEEQRVDEIAAKYLDMDFVESTYPQLAEHLLGEFKKKDLADDKNRKAIDKSIETFYKDLVEKKPKLAKDYEERVASGDKVKVPLTNSPKGTPPDKREGPAATEKTFAPNKPNSMSKGEVREGLQKLGIRY